MKSEVQTITEEFLKEKHPQLLKEFNMTFNSIYYVLTREDKSDKKRITPESSGLKCIDGITQSVIGSAIFCFLFTFYKVAKKAGEEIDINALDFRENSKNIIDSIVNELLEKGINPNLVEEIRECIIKHFNLDDKS